MDWLGAHLNDDSNELILALLALANHLVEEPTPNGRADFQVLARLLITADFVPSVMATTAAAYQDLPGWAERTDSIRDQIDRLGDAPLPTDAALLEAMSTVVDPGLLQLLRGALADGEIRHRSLMSFDGTLNELLGD